MNLGVDGRLAVVTGASRGLGLAVATSLAREGARVVLGARDEKELESASSRLREEVDRADVTTLRLDVTDPASIRSFATQVRDACGDPSILVTNAGGPPAGTYDDVTIDQYGAALELCFLFAVRLFHEFLPAMRRQGFGRIVHVASVSARQPLDGLILSNATRAAVLGFAKSVAAQVAKDGVTVNVVLPGFTATDRTIDLAAALAKKAGVTEDEITSRWTAQIPAGRMGRPEELGDTVAWLCSERASYVTGTTLAVDGGFVKGIP